MPRRHSEAHSYMQEQVAALPIRLGADEQLELCLVTSRETRRWVLPKGNLMRGVKHADAAAIEAEEEAGVRGRVVHKPYRHFDYWKRRSEAFFFCRVAVYVLVVSEEAEAWKEMNQRERRWVSPSVAFHMVLEPGLQSIFRQIEGDFQLHDLLRPKAERIGRRSFNKVARTLSMAW